MAQLTREQKSVLRRALAQSKKDNASPREQKALVEALSVESNFRNLSYGDRDSVGALQQRPSQGWGPASESLETDVSQFLKAARAANTGGGSAGALAQAVQRSGFGDRYQQRSGEADALLAQYGQGGGPSQRVKAPAGQVTAGTPAVPGVDNSAMRRQLVGQFLQQGGVQNSNAVLGLAAQYGQAADVPGIAAVPGQKVRAPSASTRTSGGVRISPRAKPGDPVVSSKQSVGGTHETAGLAGYPAKDYFAPAGTHAVAPVSGTVTRLSGHDPAQGPTNGPHGPLGYSVYIKGSDGKTYFLTHMGSRTVKAGQKVKQGQIIGTVADYDKYGTPSHIHEGVNG